MAYCTCTLKLCNKHYCSDFRVHALGIKKRVSSFYRIVKVVHSWLDTVTKLLKKLVDVVLKVASREKGMHFTFQRFHFSDLFSLSFRPFTIPRGSSSQVIIISTIPSFHIHWIRILSCQIHAFKYLS